MKFIDLLRKKIKLNYAKIKEDLGSMGKSMITVGLSSSLINSALALNSQSFKEETLATTGFIILLIGLLLWVFSHLSLED